MELCSQYIGTVGDNERLNVCIGTLFRVGKISTSNGSGYATDLPYTRASLLQRRAYTCALTSESSYGTESYFL